MSKPTGKLIRLTAGNVGAVPVGRKVNNKPLSADISLSAGDVGAYSKTETDNKVADAKKAGTDAQTKANAANTAATNANNNANGRVPSGRKVNGKPLTSDITLGAGDVGAYTKAETDSKISMSSNGAVMNIRRGASVNPPKQNEYGPKESPAGCIVTSVRHDPTTSYGIFFTYRPLQILVNGAWKTLAGDA
ncbi:hypothetical protein [Providencia rettgeri]|uniref:hypothetical protein n=1 Tax=Providencia rettgeri TaxID=587 RepID=UPI00278C0065|nr:hypothetical protein [Providencia rettgeri]